MSTAAQLALISEYDYLEGEKTSLIKHEYIDGYVYAMSGASVNHNRITMNISVMLANHLKDNPCQPYSSDMKVKIANRYFYPDVLVDCSTLRGDSYFTEAPTILVEVLSKSTRRMDETTKRMTYMQIPSLQAYILIEQDIVDIEVIQRQTGWLSEHYFLGDEFTLPSLGLTLSVEDVYARVENNDIKEWIESGKKRHDPEEITELS